MLHSRTKTVKAYGKRNTRVINIHSDFREAVLDHKHQANSVTAPSRNVLQDKTAINVIEDVSSDESGDGQVEEEKWSPVKVAKPRNPIKDTALRKKTGRVPRKAVILQEDDSPFSEPADIEAHADSSLESGHPSEQTANLDDPSSRSSIRSNQNAQSTSPSSRPVLRQRRNGRKVVESSEEIDTDDETHEKDSSAKSDSGMADSHEHAILEGLNKLSIGSDTFDYHLSDLLAICEQESASNFTSFIDSHQIASAPTRTKARGKRAAAASVPNVFRKIGEASYSEVFGVWSGSTSSATESPRIVMKVVPLDMNPTRTVSARSGKSSEDAEEDEVCLTKLEDVAKEIGITRLMNGVHEGFVKLHEAHVVCGAYPGRLLESWDAFKGERGSESPRPDRLPENQYYMLLFLANAGTDLESYRFDKATGWRQAVDVLWQVADALQSAEQEAEFEHRDLHEGQVLLSDTETGELRTTIIDFGLSRAKSTGQEEPIWSRIPDDVFDGQGEQWDVYRAMKAHIENSGNAWDSFHPVTNLMWLHYLTKRLLYATPTLVKPRSKALNRIISRRDPSRSPIRRRTTRNTASALATPMTTVNMDQGAELEAWEKLRRFEIACKAGLAEWADGKLNANGGPIKKAQQGKAKSRLGSITRSEEGVVSVGDATLWFVAND